MSSGQVTTVIPVSTGKKSSINIVLIVFVVIIIALVIYWVLNRGDSTGDDDPPEVKNFEYIQEQGIVRRNVPVGSFEIHTSEYEKDCENLCSKNTKCEGFTYISTSKTCNLFTVGQGNPATPDIGEKGVTFFKSATACTGGVKPSPAIVEEKFVRRALIDPYLVISTSGGVEQDCISQCQNDARCKTLVFDFTTNGTCFFSSNYLSYTPTITTLAYSYFKINKCV